MKKGEFNYFSCFCVLLVKQKTSDLSPGVILVVKSNNLNKPVLSLNDELSDKSQLVR